MSARSGLRAYREAGARIGDAKWFRLVAEVRVNLGSRLDEAQRSLTRKPAGDEIRTFTTRRHTGYIQQLEIYVFDKELGEVVAKPYSWRTDRLITRGRAITEAIAEFNQGIQDSPTEFNEEVLGGAYVGTYQLIPEEE